MTTEDIGPGPVTLQVLPEAARFSLRVAPAHMAAVSAALGAALPARIGERVSAGDRAALCLGPDEWVLHTTNEDAGNLTTAFAAITPDVPHSLVNISDRECGVRVSGAQAEDLLSTSCPRNLAAIASGDGVRTIFDTVPVVLLKESSTEYRLECWRSYFPHVMGLLETANRELSAGL